MREGWWWWWWCQWYRNCNYCPHQHSLISQFSLISLIKTIIVSLDKHCLLHNYFIIYLTWAETGQWSLEYTDLSHSYLCWWQQFNWFTVKILVNLVWESKSFNWFNQWSFIESSSCWKASAFKVKEDMLMPLQNDVIFQQPNWKSQIVQYRWPVAAWFISTYV